MTGSMAMHPGGNPKMNRLPDICAHCVFNRRSQIDLPADAPALVLDPRGCVVWVSDRWADHWNAETPCGLRWLEFVHSDDLQAVVSWIEGDHQERIRFRLLRPRSCEASWKSVSAVRLPMNTGCSLVVAGLDG